MPETVWSQTRTYKKVYTLDGTQTESSGSSYSAENPVTQNNKSWIVMGNVTINPWGIGGGKNTALNHATRVIYSSTAISDNIA